MAKKRQTVVGKWCDLWFCKLSPQAKLIWLYLCDNCDHIGMWECNEDLLRFQIKFTASVSIEKHLKEMDDVAEEMGIEKRIERLPGGKKLWVVNFVKIHYGELGEASSIHLTVLRELAKYKEIAAAKSILKRYLLSLDDLICRVHVGYEHTITNKKKKIIADLNKEVQAPLSFSQDEVLQAFKTRGGTVKMAENFYAKHASAEWLDGHKRPIKNFLPLVGVYIANWKENDAKTIKRNGSKTNNSLGSSIEFDHA